MTQDAVAILYQALPPPVIDGLRKDAKPGGYSDGGADIAFVLRGQGHRVLTPAADPDPTRPLDWVFPDTVDGIATAIAAGATILWANSVLFEGHPLEAVLGQVRIVGQLPELMQRYDDKFATNRMLEQDGLPVARSFLMAQAARAGVWALAEVEAALAEAGLSFPLIVKPVRGRGSQGVSRVADLVALRAAATGLIADAKFGDTLIIEEYLAGEEVTVTVMPPAGDGRTHRALRPVRRFDQKDGVAPYNGDVAVTANSVAISEHELASPTVQAMLGACVRAAALVGARAPIRIDCRADASGNFKLFDLNMKPNMTGPGRPGRDDQDCLSAIAARADGWDFARLLEAMLGAAW
ncbi:biotin carboxylase [Sphingobium sp.]|uniref:biotin carboxylase n=1 Tax=Sphingobium sp. TaxID=1912891 RepID=UPI002C98D90E|nr:biotin carboxylase [Sphingobium sp.]HUD93096.1 biotin carboxylase [Sphingobium sp.]